MSHYIVIQPAIERCRIININHQLGQAGDVTAVPCEITDSQLVENALDQSEALYQAILEAKTKLICRFLPAGILNFANFTYCCFGGQEPQDVLAKSVFLQIPEVEREVVKQHLTIVQPK